MSQPSPYIFLLKRRFKNEKSLNYWANYIKLDVKYTRSRRHVHYFNDIAYTPWPFHISVCVFLLILFFVAYLHHFEWAGKYVVFSLLLLLVPVLYWALDLYYDSVFLGKFTFKVRRSMLGGFFLFLISEVCVFAGFIWAYFDRYFHTPAQIGGSSAPLGLEMISWNGLALIGTFFLLASGWACNQAYYAIRGGSITYFEIWNYIGIILGICFILLIQLKEYEADNFLSMSDSVIGSCFYLITGFHGVHVCVGVVLLVLASSKILNWDTDRDRVFLYAIALTYWHFVDRIRLFVYTFLYVMNGNIMYSNVDLLIYKYYR